MHIQYAFSVSPTHAHTLKRLRTHSQHSYTVSHPDTVLTHSHSLGYRHTHMLSHLYTHSHTNTLHPKHAHTLRHIHTCSYTHSLKHTSRKAGLKVTQTTWAAALLLRGGHPNICLVGVYFPSSMGSPYTHKVGSWSSVNWVASLP